MSWVSCTETGEAHGRPLCDEILGGAVAGLLFDRQPKPIKYSW